MRITAIDSPHAIECPACTTCLATVTASTFDTTSGRHLLTDGDSIPGAQEALARIAPGGGAEAALMVGECHSCGHGFYMVDLTVIEGGTNEDVIDWLAGAWGDGDDVRHHLAQAEGLAPWIVSRVNAGENRTVDEHLIGPFVTDVRALRGRAGVSACSAHGVLPQVWEQARAAVGRAAAHLEIAASSAAALAG